MNIDLLKSYGNHGVLRLEVTADDLINMMREVTRETINSVLAKFNDERSTEFISRKEAMKKLDVKTALTMIRWEEKGILNPHKNGGRVYYRENEIVACFEKFSRTDFS